MSVSLCEITSFFFLLEIHIELLNTAGSKMACMGCVTHRPWMMYWSVQLCCSRFIDMFFNASEPPSGDPSCAPCLSQACARRSDFTRHQSQPTRLHYSRGVSGPISLLGTQSTTRILLKEGGGQMVTTKSVLEVSLKCWPPLKWMDTYSRVSPDTKLQMSPLKYNPWLKNVGSALLEDVHSAVLFWRKWLTTTLYDEIYNTIVIFITFVFIRIN